MSSSAAIVRGARSLVAHAAKLRTYLSASAQLAIARPDRFDVGELARWYGTWSRSLDSVAPTVDVPWLCFAATELLEGFLSPDMKVFEYGSGGSTVFLSRRVSRVWSVEHDPQWHAEIRARLARERVTNCDLRLVEPEAGDERDPSDPYAFASGDARFRRASFERYVTAIAEHPDSSLDLVLIDGRSRPSCCRAALSKVRVGGYLVLDNAEVPYYQRAQALLDPAVWDLVDVYGPIPGMRHFSETRFWRRKEA